MLNMIKNILPSNFSDLKSLNEDSDEETGSGHRIAGYGYLAGMIPTANYLKFARNIHRLSRGNMMLKKYNFDKENMDLMQKYMPHIKHNMNMSIILLIYSTSQSGGRGGYASSMELKLRMTCETYDVVTAELPRSKDGIPGEIQFHQAEISKLEEINNKTKEHINEILEGLAATDNPDSIAFRTYNKAYKGFSYIDEFSL